MNHLTAFVMNPFDLTDSLQTGLPFPVSLRLKY
jgi:hypothetical protein